MRSEAKTVAVYLEELPQDRREALDAVRKTVLASLPAGYEETVDWGMITYQVPLATYPDTYNKKPLMYAALASQKNHMAVYLSGIYADDEARARFEEDYRATGKRIDVGKSCVRFRTLENLPLDVIAKAIGSLEVDEFIRVYEKGRAEAKGAKAAKTAKAAKAPKTKPKRA